MIKLSNNISSRLSFWFLIIALLPLILAISYSYQVQKHEMNKNAVSKLKAIRDLKVDRINSWLDERSGDLIITARDFDITDIEAAINDISNPENKKIFEKVSEILINYKMNFPDYEEIFVIDPNTKKTIVSTDPTQKNIDYSQNSLFIQPLKTQKLYIKDHCCPVKKIVT